VLIVLALFILALAIRLWNLELGLRASFDEVLSLDAIACYYDGFIGLVGRPNGYIPTLLFAQWRGRSSGCSVTR
jgi:hypothetical protein